MLRRPNILMIVLDDVGFGQLGCYGSPIETPTIDRLASNGLRYNRFHVTSLCSPTRACLMTGRNHHAVGFGMTPEYQLNLPGYNGRIPPSAGTMPRILRDAGYNTYAIGKWHLTPLHEQTAAGPFQRWPLGLGFERYFGFINAQEDHWAPCLQMDNTFIEPRAESAERYHLTEDLISKAIQMITDQQNVGADKPFLLYLALGAGHNPHHAPKEWIAGYHGCFDEGWERFRENTFDRQLRDGVIPEGTKLTERPSWVQAWADLSADERRIFARMQEVHAGFLSHADAQIGRLITLLESTGLLENTLTMLLSDNGASAEGGPFGVIGPERYASNVEAVTAMIPRLDEIGAATTQPNYSWGWAWAGNTPFRLWKRYAWLGGTRTPLIAHWPRVIKQANEVRTQFVHAIDLMPTILEVCGIDVPRTIDGVAQDPIDGASIASTFHNADATSPRSSQYFEVFGSRSMVHGEWKATTNHVVQYGVEPQLIAGSQDFEQDAWALFDMQVDFSEADDVSSIYPEVVDELKALWWKAASRNNILPLMDSTWERMTLFGTSPWRPCTRMAFRPSTTPIPTTSLPYLAGGFRFTAEVDIPDVGAAGVLLALGDWHAGISLYLDNERLQLIFNLGGRPRRLTSKAPLVTGRTSIGCTYMPGGDEGNITIFQDADVLGTLRLDGVITAGWQLLVRHLTVGCDRGLPADPTHPTPYRWTGGLDRVVLEVPDTSPLPNSADHLQTVLEQE